MKKVFYASILFIISILCFYSCSIKALNIDTFEPQKNATFKFVVKNFDYLDGHWNQNVAYGVVPIEQSVIVNLENSGYVYTTDKNKARYLIEAYLTCFSPKDVAIGRAIDEAVYSSYYDSPWFYDSPFHPYLMNQSIFIWSPSLDAMQAGPNYCAGKMLVMIKDTKMPEPKNVYAGRQEIPLCAAYTSRCGFGICEEKLKNNLINYLNVFFYDQKTKSESK